MEEVQVPVPVSGELKEASSDVKLFGRWTFDDVTVHDMALQDYIGVSSVKHATYVPHTAGRYQPGNRFDEMRSMRSFFIGDFKAWLTLNLKICLEQQVLFCVLASLEAKKQPGNVASSPIIVDSS